jgi:hypothetical protein
MFHQASSAGQAFPENAVKLSLKFATHTSWAQRSMKQLAGAFQQSALLRSPQFGSIISRSRHVPRSAFGFAMRQGADEQF